MANDALPACVIASSNRQHDIQPYCASIYRKDPTTWGSIFPWDFPQGGVKEEEEAFLRSFFSETEIHMQGGAHGDGHGFRFLAQVWHSIAFFNLNQRIPDFTHWWLAKPSSISFLNDPQMQPFFFRNDVTPSTFFQEEIPEYGTKFLNFVIPYLQSTVRKLLQAKLDRNQLDSISGGLTPTDSVIGEVSNEGNPKTGQDGHEPPIPEAHQSEVRVVSSTVSEPAEVQPSPNPSSIAPQSAPPLTTTFEPAQSSKVADDNPPRPEIQDYKYSRGNSGSKRYNKRSGGNVQTRQPHILNERNTPAYSSPAYGASPMPTPSDLRVASGGSIEFMPSLPQGQPFQVMQHPGPHVGPHFAQTGPMQHSFPHNMPYMYGGTPAAHFSNPFADRSNEQYAGYAFNGESNMTYYDDPRQFRGGHRRNSQGSRGGRARGNTGPRGRGNRGRNSFNSIDQPPFVSHGERMNHKPFGEFSEPQYQPKTRRGSVIQERNWRSNSDHPQTEQNEGMMKENMIPGQQFIGAGNHAMPFVNQHPPRPIYATKPPYEGSVPYPPRSSVPNFQGAVPQHVPYAQGRPAGSGPAPQSHEETCGQTWIGEKCQYANKLIVFDVPQSVTEHEMFDFFSAYGRVQGVAIVHSHKAPDAHRNTQLMFVTFATAGEARNCLNNKQKDWLDGRPLRVEVSKQYWDPDYYNQRASKFRQPSMHLKSLDTPNTAPQAPKILHRSEENTPTTEASSTGRPAIEDAPSGETTPTPSAASTPKKNKSKSGKHKNKKYQQDLRKVSLTASADQHMQTEAVDKNSDINSPAPTTDDSEGLEAAKSKDTNKLAIADAPVIDQQRSGSGQTDRQASSELAVGSIDVIENSLPGSHEEAHVTSSTAASCDSTQTHELTSEHTDIQTASEMKSSPTDKTSVEAAENRDEADQPFREDDEETQKAEAADSDNQSVMSTIVEPAQPSKDAGTPRKSEVDPVDDSFHTASGSPDTDKEATVGKKGGPGDSGNSASAAQECEASTDAKHIDTDISTQSDSSVTLGSPESTTSVKANKKAHIPHVPTKSRPSMSSNASTTSTVKPQALEVPPRSGSGGSAGLPTPAFFTAPNTPAVLQEPLEPPKNEEETKSGAPASKKEDKSKGPAKTESFSMFGKKREKKSKPGKKGTLKGKPKADASAMSDITSGNTSRVMSRTATPTVDTVLKDVKNNGETNMGRQAVDHTDSKISDSHKQSSMGESLIAPQESTSSDETPGKRKSLGDIFSGFPSLLFGATQQPKVIVKEPESETAVPPKDSVTSSKTPDPILEIEAKKSFYDLVEPLSKVDESTKNGKIMQFDPSLSGDMADTEPGSVDVSGAGGPALEVGLGISSLPAADGESKQHKKKAKKKKRSKKKSPEAIGEQQQEQKSSPAHSEGKKVLEMYRFGTDSSPPDDARSDSSSHTLGREETPTSDVQSPTPSASAKKHPFRPAEEGHLVKAKEPTWKKKRNSRTPEISSEMAEDEDEIEEIDFIDDQSEGGDDKKTSSPARDSNGKKTLYIYMGGLRDDTAGMPPDKTAVEMSKEKLFQLAKEESARRKSGDGAGSDAQ